MVRQTHLIVGLFASISLFVPLMVMARRTSMSIVATSYILRLLLVYAQALGLVLPDSQADAVDFEMLAWEWARDGYLFDDFRTGASLYSWVASAVYLVVGRIPTVLRIINAFFGTLIVHYVMRTVMILTPAKRCRCVAGWVMALYPSTLLYSALTMREVAVVLSFSMSLYFLVKWVAVGRITRGLLSLVLAATAQLFHSGMIMGTLSTAAIYLRGIARGARARAFVVYGLWFGAIVVALVLAIRFGLETGIGMKKVVGLLTELDLEIVARWQRYAARGRAGYLANLQIETWSDVVWQTPLRLFFFLGSPYIWMVSRLDDLLGLVDGLFFVYVVVRISRDIRGTDVWRSPEYRVIGVVTAAVILTFALATSNYGTAFRHRAKVLPPLVVLYTYGRYVRERAPRLPI